MLIHHDSLTQTHQNVTFADTYSEEPSKQQLHKTYTYRVLKAFYDTRQIYQTHCILGTFGENLLKLNCLNTSIAANSGLFISPKCPHTTFRFMMKR